MSNPSLKRGRLIISALVLLLLVLHQDNWNWENSNLVFGFVPVTLFYQMCISLGAGAVWFLATRIAWPDDLEEKVLSEVKEMKEKGGAK
ncbi:MAG TPA: DUF3311 domain-containing protein [Planctomycetaceae bacterium]|nr:DUF3311 domain-containing protein [Planctomycetaceae bacterium]